MSEKPFGIDISSWQGKVDWDIVGSHVPKVRFVGIRASYGQNFSDPQFKRNWTEAKDRGIPRMAYHYMLFEFDVERQMDRFMLEMDNDYGEIGLVLDCEDNRGYGKVHITNCVNKSLGIMQQRSKKIPIIYSRANWTNDFIDVNEIGNPYWWLAQWLHTPEEHPGPPWLPKGVNRNRCLVHQTTAKGTPFGMATLQLDYDRWQFPQAHLDSFTGTTPTPEPPPTEPTLEKKVNKLWDAHPEIH